MENYNERGSVMSGDYTFEITFTEDRLKDLFRRLGVSEEEIEEYGFGDFESCVLDDFGKDWLEEGYVRLNRR